MKNATLSTTLFSLDDDKNLLIKIDENLRGNVQRHNMKTFPVLQITELRCSVDSDIPIRSRPRQDLRSRNQYISFPFHESTVAPRHLYPTFVMQYKCLSVKTYHGPPIFFQLMPTIKHMNQSISSPPDMVMLKTNYVAATFTLHDPSLQVLRNDAMMHEKTYLYWLGKHCWTKTPRSLAKVATVAIEQGKNRKLKLSRDTLYQRRRQNM